MYTVPLRKYAHPLARRYFDAHPEEDFEHAAATCMFTIVRCGFIEENQFSIIYQERAC